MQEIATKRKTTNSRLGFAAIVLSTSLLASSAMGQALNNNLPSNFQAVGVDQKLGEQLPLDAMFFDEDGNEIELRSMFDGKRPVLLTLNYSDCPMLCSLQLNNLVTALQEIELEIGEEFRVVTVSIDPKETPRKISETKQKYVGVLKRDGAEQGWRFLTGKQQSITSLANAVGFRYEFVPETGQYSHAAMLAFCTPDGSISSYVLMIDYPPKQVKLGLISASDGSIGSLVDNFVLYCSSYNPIEGSYTASAWKIMRMCGALTVIVLLFGLVPYWIGRRKSDAQEEEITEDQATLEGQHVAGVN